MLFVNHDPQIRFNSLVKKREKALNIFRKAHDGLIKTHGQIVVAADKSRAEIETLKEQINNEELAIKFLMDENSRVKKTAEKIKEVLGD